MPRQLKPCGTFAAYQRHRAHGEQPCDPCREASRQYQRDYRAGGPSIHLRPAPAPHRDSGVQWLLDVPVGAILADRFGHAVERMQSGAFWVLGERWPHLASEIADRGPFVVLIVPTAVAS